MKKYTIAFGSVTIAIKAQSVLSRYGFSSEVVRTPKMLSAGCGYSITGFGNASDVIDILDKFNIKYRAVMES